MPVQISPGIFAVQQRIATIQSQVAGALGQTDAPTDSSTTGSSTANFPNALAQATAAGTAGAGSATTAAATRSGLPVGPGPAGAAAVGRVGSGSGAGSGGVGAAGPVGVDANGRVVIPDSLRAHGNGKIPTSALSSIGRGGHRLYGPAATAFTRLLADATRQGVEIGVTDSYRSYDGQVDVARRKGLYSEGGLAAKPGTSKHGWGLAVDLDLNSRAQTWMRANAERYGFVEDTPREPWHWAYHGTSAV